jgi:phenylalanyl-tRNA synthetase beta chain
MDPAAAFAATAAGESVGWAGRVRPAAIDAPAWAGDVFALELDVTGIALPPLPEFRALPAFPAIERDVALLLPQDLPAGRVLATTRAAGGEFLEAAWPFDLYRGAGLPAGMRSVAFRLRFRAPDRTLTDDEIDSQVGRVLKRLRDEHDVQRRS